MLDITADKNHEKDAYVISLSGLLDSETSRDFESFFSDMLNKGYRYYILEASRLTGMSSSGISELIKFLQNVYNAGGTVCFTGLNKEVRMLLEFSGIALKCPLFINIREAENYIQRTIAGSSSFVQGYDNTPHVSSMQKSEKSRDIFRDE
jgi:anti-anti-sigma factor